MRIFIAVFLFASNMILYSCSDVNGISEPDQERTIDWVIQNRPQDLVVVAAKFTDNSRKLVLFDYYNPQNYKIVTDDSFGAVYPVFSNDKKKIIFGDWNDWANEAGPALMLYDVVRDTVQPIIAENFYSDNNLPGINMIWNADDTGFYFAWEGTWYGQRVMYYDFETKLYSDVYFHRGHDTYAVSLVPPDKLIVFSDDSLVTGQPEGFYYMSTEGEFLLRINIEKLVYYSPHGIRAPTSCVQWNNVFQLFAFTEIGNFITGGMPIGRISLSNKDGSFYYQYSSGNYDDSFPQWTSDGNILFLREDYPVKTIPPDKGKIMKIEYNSGNITEFFTPEFIANCIGIHSFDY